METQLPQKGHSSPQFSAHVYYGQMAEWIKIALGMEVGLGPGQMGTQPLPFPERGTAAPHFSAYVYCGQTTGCIRILLGTEVGLGPGDSVLDGDPAPRHRKGHSSYPHFSTHFALAWSPISATAQLLYLVLLFYVFICH